MLVTSLIVTCILALVGVFQTLPISTTFARMLTPTVSAPTRTQRVAGPTAFLTLDPVVLLPAVEHHWTSPRGLDDPESFQTTAPRLPRKSLESLVSVTIYGTPVTALQSMVFWIAGALIAASIVVSCTAFSGANASSSKSHLEEDCAQLAVLPSEAEVRHLSQQIATTPRKCRPRAERKSSGRASQYEPQSHYLATPHVAPWSTNAPSRECDHTSRRAFGVPRPAHTSERSLGGLDDPDDVSYLRDALGLIDWSDIPPHCGYWGPTQLDQDVSSENDGDEARPRKAWYMPDDDLRGWAFPARPLRPGRSESAQLLVAGEG
ncbi:hypothetical protein OH76DRAFT_1402878 [Lentinus brumalis]|uniref:Uncharacterized protein n=1 Tax=Lentinus brumalis TaxID=2498619 RepID=A0A371DC46_9APHY|nr:hypothetical protein OH76DRAFT_1402878 [Polyporus brumalis]